jgi:hypothetical protein
MNPPLPNEGEAELLGVPETIRPVWVVEGGKLVEYERSGACNGCADCCKARIRFQRATASANHPPSEEKGADDYSAWEGWAVIEAMGLWWWYKPLEVTYEAEPCRLLRDDRCTVFSDPMRFPAICRIWPVHPSEMASFPRCGFRFERKET